MSAFELRKVLEAAPVFQSERPLPLVRSVPEPDPFPVDALGVVLAGAVRAIEDQTQAPVEIAAQSVLAVATLATQSHVDVKLPTGQTRPVSSFFLSVAESGERKSAVDGLALWPVRKREDDLSNAYGSEYEHYQNQLESWEAQRKQILSDKKVSCIETKRAKLNGLGPKPAAPMGPILICAAPTWQALEKQFLTGHPSLGLFSGEGGRFINGHSMNDDNKVQTAAGVSELWDNGVVERIRVGDGASKERGRRLSVHLMVQPDIARVMLSDRMLLDQGLLSRFLVSFPRSKIGDRMWKEPSPASAEALRQYYARSLLLLESPYVTATGNPRELLPRTLVLDAGARSEWIGFVDHNERQMGPGGELAPIRGLANKLGEHAARLATVLATFDNAQTESVTLDHMAAGIQIAQYYAGEALRLFHAGHADPDLVLAQTLLEWLHQRHRGKPIGLRTVYQMGPNAIRSKAKASAVLKILEDHGYLRAAPHTVIEGETHRQAWEVK